MACCGVCAPLAAGSLDLVNGMPRSCLLLCGILQAWCTQLTALPDLLALVGVDWKGTTRLIGIAGSVTPRV